MRGLVSGKLVLPLAFLYQHSQHISEGKLTEVNFILNTGDTRKFYSVCSVSAIKIFVMLLYLLLDISDE